MKREVRLSSKIKIGLYGHALIVRFLIVYYNNTTFGLEKKTNISVEPNQEDMVTHKNAWSIRPLTRLLKTLQQIMKEILYQTRSQK